MAADPSSSQLSLLPFQRPCLVHQESPMEVGEKNNSAKNSPMLQRQRTTRLQQASHATGRKIQPGKSVTLLSGPVINPMLGQDEFSESETDSVLSEPLVEKPGGKKR